MSNQSTPVHDTFNEIQEEVKSSEGSTGSLSNHMSNAAINLETSDGNSARPLTSCSICYTDFNTYNHLPLVTPCFHTICSISLSRLVKAECPICRTALPSNFRQQGVLPRHSGIMSLLNQSSSSSSSSMPPSREHKEQEAKAPSSVSAASSLSNIIGSLSGIRAPRIDRVVRRDRETVDNLLLEAGFDTFNDLTRYLDRYYRAEQDLSALDIQKLALQRIMDEVTPILDRLQALYQMCKAQRQVSRASKRRRSNDGDAAPVGEHE